MNAYNKTELMNSLHPSLCDNMMQIIVDSELHKGDFILRKASFFKQKKNIWYEVLEVATSKFVHDRYKKCKPPLKATKYYHSVKVKLATKEQMNACDELVSQRDLIAQS